MAYPIAQGKLINFAATYMRHDLENTPFPGNPVSTAEPEEFAAHFAHWEPEARALLNVRIPSFRYIYIWSSFRLALFAARRETHEMGCLHRETTPVIRFCSCGTPRRCGKESSPTLYTNFIY